MQGSGFESQSVEDVGSKVSVCLLALTNSKLECGVQGSGFRVQGSGFRVQDSGFRVQGSGFRVQGSGSRVQGLGFGV